jgi:hypothetical protein
MHWGSGCTNSLGGPYTITIDVTPTQVGTYMAFLTAAGNDSTTADYNLEVSCVVGKCTPPRPTCSVTDTLSYTSGILTMNFTVESGFATTWNIWLTDLNNMTLVYSAPPATTTSPTAITKSTPLAPEDKVGVISTLTTPSKGIACSSWVQFSMRKP